jgi:16S rRNA (cytosine967-C5)-methyltransferase
MIRNLAWEILRAGYMAPTREVAGVAARAGLDARDRGLLARIVRTEVQRRGTLQALVHAFANGKPSRDVSAFLRLGFAQLFFMDKVPDHAAVSETVGAASDELGLAKGRYVNGVLRTAIRASEEGQVGDPRRDLVGRNISFNFEIFHDPSTHPFLWAEDALSVPAPLYKGWVKRFGEDCARKMALDSLSDPRLSLRVVKGTREELQAEFTELGFSTECGQHEHILTVASGDLDKALNCEAFQEGRVTVQGEAALRAAEFCNAKAGESWLDLCAAPGGKTVVLAKTAAKVLACDVSEAKIERMTETMVRLGAVDNIETRLLDDREPPAEKDFDGVLLDVPCSNTGVLARRPEARWRFGPQNRKALADIQRTMLDHGASRVRPGGVLVYSTCAIEPDENQQRIKAFLEANPGWVLENEVQTLPQPCAYEGPVDGGYVARLVKPS